MCGICGIVGFSLSNAEGEHIVRKMMDSLAHRGPDDEGLAKDAQFIFGHKRLSIIDLDYGHQPMQTGDGMVTIVFNGEIYNYIELRQELIRKGVHFKTFSDTEVLLKLYEQEGDGCLGLLNGMFAFAVFDKRRNLFFAARDHFGIKPFYYYELPDKSIVFASEIKAILKHPMVQAAAEMEAIQEYLTFQFCLNDRTLFKGVKKLEPGHMMQWSPLKEDAVTVRQYWTQSYEIDTHHTEEYFLDRLLILLEDSIRQQLRSDVPLGAYLSGGIDSSTVATLAGMQYGKGFQCFTGKFDEGLSYDESRYAQIIASSINATLHTVVPSAEDFVRLMPKLIYYLDEPVAGPGTFPQLMVSELAVRNVKVVLGGQGGDEIFGGYARYLVAYLEQCLKGAIYETREEGKHIVTLSSIIQNLPMLKEYVPMIKEFWKDGLFDPMDRRYFRLIDRSHDIGELLSGGVSRLFDKEKMFMNFSAVFNSPDTMSYVNKMIHFDQKTLLPALLQIEDRVSMAVSLESRVPILDFRIVELVNSMPPALKFKEGKLKNVLREAMKNLLPVEISSRRDKMGFPVPLKEWVSNGAVRDFIRDVILGKSSRERGLFNIEEVEKLLDTEKSFGRQIWGVLCLELWHQTFIDRNNSCTV